MKKIILSCLLLLITQNVHAGTQAKDDVGFDFKIEKVFLNNDSVVQFDTKIVDNLADEGIVWKARAYCDKNMSIYLLDINKSSICLKSKKVQIENNLFPFVFINKTSGDKKFTITLMSYNTKGKWLGTQKENIRWD